MFDLIMLKYPTFRLIFDLPLFVKYIDIEQYSTHYLFFSATQCEINDNDYGGNIEISKVLIPKGKSGF